MSIEKFDEFIAPVAVAYIGVKPSKRDTVANTGVVWNGFGDVQVVDARAASLLLKYPTVWCKKDDLKDVGETLKREAAEAAKAEAITEQEVAKPKPVLEPTPEDNAKKEAVKAAILALDTANPDHFQANGKPKIKVVNVLLGDGLTATAQDVAEAYAELGGE